MGLENRQPQLGCREGNVRKKKSKAVFSEWSLRGEK